MRIGALTSVSLLLTPAKMSRQGISGKLFCFPVLLLLGLFLIPFAQVGIPSLQGPTSLIPRSTS